MPRRATPLVGHTACHAASLALNRALADRWSKPAREDALGAPDFDGTAIASSRIVPNGSVDRYRLNKSLRRAGFDTGGSLRAATRRHPSTATLEQWIATDARVRVERGGRRSHRSAHLGVRAPDGTARIPCGGTHAGSLGELGPR